MKILIVCQKLNDQVQFLAHELEKMSIHVELTDKLHPVRLILNKYNLIHFIHNDAAIDLKTVLSAWSAKTLGIATLFTTYSRLKPSLLHEFEFNFFDAITLPYISELKKMRFFSGQKMILPYFPNKDLLGQKEIFQNQPQFVFPILQDFEDLLKINFSALTALSGLQNIYVGAHLLRQKKSASVVRKEWMTFVKKNSQFKNFKLFTERSTLHEVLSDNTTYTFIHHLDLSSDQVCEWMETALVYNNFLILHEDQGTGFSHFWKTEKNCFIYSPRISSSVQYHSINTLIEKNPSPEKLSFEFRSSLDVKLNDLARLYTKIVAKKASLMHQGNVT